MHKNIELFLNARADFAWDDEMLHFIRWLQEVAGPRGWVPFRTEWSIFDDINMVAGQIDSLWLDPQGCFVFMTIFVDR